MFDVFTVSFFSHRQIDRFFDAEEKVAIIYETLVGVSRDSDVIVERIIEHDFWFVFCSENNVFNCSLNPSPH